jgi:hypothetical protein
MGGSDGWWVDEDRGKINCQNGRFFGFMHGFDTEEGLGWTTHNKVSEMFVEEEVNLFIPYTVESGVAQVEVSIQLFMDRNYTIMLRKV